RRLAREGNRRPKTRETTLRQMHDEPVIAQRREAAARGPLPGRRRGLTADVADESVHAQWAPLRTGPGDRRAVHAWPPTSRRRGGGVGCLRARGRADAASGTGR